MSPPKYVARFWGLQNFPIQRVAVALFLVTKRLYRASQNYVNTNEFFFMVKERGYRRKIRDINDLKDRIRNVISSVPHEMCVRALNGTVARW